MKHSEETKRKISESIKKKWKDKEFEKINWHLSGAKGSKGRYKNPDNILEISSRTVRKVISRLREEENLGCSRCGWNEGSGDLHHINGRKIDNPDNHNNLSYICPNCHRLIHEGKIDKKELISFFEQIGDKWKNYYHG